MAENTVRKQRGKPFKPGQSGNPAGKPAGAKNRATLAALELLEGEASALTRKAIDAALGGDMAALRLCLDRIVPPAKDRPVSIKFPAITSATDLPKITAALLAAVGAGEIGPTEATTLAKLVEVHRGALEVADITERIKRLEEKVKK
ncbi:MAG: hypothetical protein KKA54_11185 [Proteobacteria bacterium]|nr:hypothetical protein [Pseudomonadota bacterium]